MMIPKFNPIRQIDAWRRDPYAEFQKEYKFHYLNIQHGVWLEKSRSIEAFFASYEIFFFR
jgi:hypothetical protein